VSDTNSIEGAASTPAEDRSTLHVAVGTTNDKVSNTVVVAGYAIEFPLEADLDADPLHDDVLRLEGVDGSTCESSGFRLDPDSSLLLHRFEDVLPGIYVVTVMLADGRWSPVLSNVVVTKDGATVSGVRAKEEPPPALSAEERPEPAAEDPDAEEPDTEPGGSGFELEVPIAMTRRSR
jgi:hypothetical protein